MSVTRLREVCKWLSFELRVTSLSLSDQARAGIARGSQVVARSCLYNQGFR